MLWIIEAFVGEVALDVGTFGQLGVGSGEGVGAGGGSRIRGRNRSQVWEAGGGRA